MATCMAAMMPPSNAKNKKGMQGDACMPWYSIVFCLIEMHDTGVQLVFISFFFLFFGSGVEHGAIKIKDGREKRPDFVV